VNLIERKEPKELTNAVVSQKFGKGAASPGAGLAQLKGEFFSPKEKAPDSMALGALHREKNKEKSSPNVRTCSYISFYYIRL